MVTPGKSSAAAPPRANKPPPAGATRPVLLVVGLMVGAYIALFFLAPLHELHDLSRARLLGQNVLLLDEVVRSWFGDPAEFAVVDRLRVFLPALALLGLSGLSGWLLLHICRADQGLRSLEIAFFSCAVGLSAVSLYTFAVGILGLLHDRALFVVPAVAVAVASGWQFLRLKQRRSAADAPDLPDVARASASDRRWLLWAIPFSLVIVLGGTLTPLDFDVREYHLQAPKEFFQSGRITFLPHNVYGNMPLGSEMLSLAAMAVTGDWWLGGLIGKTAIALCAPLTAGGLFTAGRRYVGNTAGVVAAVVYLSVPWIARVSALGLVEGVSALYLWGTVYALLTVCLPSTNGRLDHRPLARITLAGFLAGSAVACKYPNLVFVLVPAAMFTGWWLWRSRGGASSAQRAPALPGTVACFLLAALVACGPWFAKNWALTGNPTYPLLYAVFGGATRTDALDAQWNRAHRPPGFAPSQVIEAVQNFAWRSSWQSPLVLPLALLGVWGARNRPLARGLALYVAFVLVAWWLFTHRIDRFWVPIYPVLCFLGGMAVEQNNIGHWRRLLKTLLGAGLAVNLLLVATGGAGDTAYFVSLARLEADRQRIHAGHQFLNKQLRADDVVLAVGDAVMFDLRMPVLYSTVFDENLFEQLLKGRSASEQRQALAERDVRYVAVDWLEIGRYRSPGNYGFTDYVTPELLDQLIRDQVLDPPLVVEEDAPQRQTYQVFPVHGASTR